MKISNTILSLILLILSCLPCADMEINNSAHSALEMNSKHDNHSHDKENDNCPPFCICNCCGAQILSYVPEMSFNFPVLTSIIKIPLPTYKSILSSNLYGSIWQPPQIA